MSADARPRINKLPFLIADLLLLAAAAAIVQFGHRPFGGVEILGVMTCVALAGWFSVTPFLKQFEADQRQDEADRFASAVTKIQQLESIATRIEVSTAEWQTLQENSGRSATAAREVGDRIAAEARAFADFMQKANDTEKSHLRLEVEKLRRSESDWLQIVIRTLDHIHALHQAAVRSGQAQLIEQLGAFQAAVRDLARRIGINVLPAEPGEPFDDARHQLPDTDAPVPTGAMVAAILAVGFTFQGQLVRRAIVAVHEAAPAPLAVEPSPEPVEADVPVANETSDPTPIEPPLAVAEEVPPTDEREVQIIDSDTGEPLSEEELAAPVPEPPPTTALETPKTSRSRKPDRPKQSSLF